MIFVSLILTITFLTMIQSFRLQPFRGAQRLGLCLKMSTAAPNQLVLLRHGESTWNDENKFTGWYDCPLSAKGEQEAIAAGKLLKENKFKFDLAYTSYLQRAIKTLWHTLEQTGHMYIPIKNVWQLNERC